MGARNIENEFATRFFASVLQLYPQSSRQYRGTGISDLHFCQLGVLRCLSSSVTGQEFLQFHADQGMANIEPSHFFKAPQSSRRLANITSLNDLLAGPMKRHIPDPYTQCAELDDWDLYAVDGHYHKAALTRATQRTQRFIRWVRVRIYKQAPWDDSIARLREVWGGIYS